MNDRDLMQQALDALTYKKWWRVGLGEPKDPKLEAAITSLNKRLAQPEQEPMASLLAAIQAEPVTLIHKWRVLELVKEYAAQPAAPMTEFEEAVAACDNTLHYAIDYWQDKACEQSALLRKCRVAIDRLIKKQPSLSMTLCGSTTLGNLKASLYDYRVIFDDTPPAAQPAQQEPVAWEDLLGAIARGWGHPKNAHKTMDVELAVAIAKEIQDLYTTPPAAQRPLTTEAIRAAGGIVHKDGNVFFTNLEQLNQAIEAAHGIKEKNNG